MKKIFIIISLLMLTASISFAENWDIQFSLGSSYYTGNIDKFDLQSAGTISRSDSLFEYSTFIKLNYGELESQKTNQEISGGIKFDYKPYNTFSPFFALSAYNNEYKDIKLRVSGLLGLKYTFYRTEKSDFSISGAGVYDYEKYESETQDKELLKISIRSKLKQKIGDKTKISNVTFYKPDIEDFDDYTIESVTSLTNQLIGKIDIKLSYEYSYDSKPPVGIEDTDTAFITSIVVNF